MPGGRPSKIDQVVGYVGEGDQRRAITAADQIVNSLRIGDYFESAVAVAGVSKETAYGWVRTGAQATAAQHRAIALGIDPPELTDHERRCVEFSDAVVRATAEWHQRALSTLDGLARGATVKRTTTKVVAGQVVETIVTEEERPPDAHVIMWRLARRFPERYSTRIELAGAELPLEDLTNEQAGSLAELLASFSTEGAPVLDVVPVDEA